VANSGARARAEHWAAAGLVGVAVKLRLLTDEAIGLSESCPDEVEGEALRDICRVIEQELKAREEAQAARGKGRPGPTRLTLRIWDSWASPSRPKRRSGVAGDGQS